MRTEAQFEEEQRVTCIVGLGHPYRQDDRVGLVVLEELQEDVEQEGVLLYALGDDVTRLLDVLPRCNRLILVDGVITGACAGHVHVWTWGPEFTVRQVRFSSHALSPVEMLRLAERMGEPIPPTTIIGIEVEQVGHGEGLSPAVQAAVVEVRGLIARILEEDRR